LLTSKKYRDAFVLEHARNSIAFQIRVLREERGWTQKKLGDEAGKPSNVISRLEDPNYGKPSLSTLFEIASACDCGVLVKFVPFTRLLREYEDVSPLALSSPEITKEKRKLEAWARERDRKDASADKSVEITAGPYAVVEGSNSSQTTLAFDRNLVLTERIRINTTRPSGTGTSNSALNVTAQAV